MGSVVTQCCKRLRCYLSDIIHAGNLSGLVAIFALSHFYNRSRWCSFGSVKQYHVMGQWENERIYYTARN
jgi:hypothetical protein